GVDVAEHAGEFPPGRARPFEQPRLYQAEEQQHAADSRQDFGTADPSPPPQRQRDDDEDAADGDAERPFRILGTFGHESYCTRSRCARRVWAETMSWCWLK